MIAEELGRLRRVIERDRSEVAQGVTAIKRVIASRVWVREGRGPAAYDDDLWMAEFSDAMDEVEVALQPLSRVASDLTDCPRNNAEVQRARREPANRGGWGRSENTGCFPGALP